MYATRFDAFRTIPSGTTIAATNSGGTATSVSLTAGSYTAATLAVHIAARLNAVRTPATWTVDISYTTGLCTIDCVGETWAITFTTTTAGTVLGFVGNISSTSDPATGTQNVRGLWLPDCPLDLEGDPVRAPLVTDLRTTESPTGAVYGLVGTSKYRHRGLRLSHVSRARTWEGSASTAYSSWEAWLKDTQLGAGHAWFTAASAFQPYWDNAGTAAIIGADLNSGAGATSGWQMTGLDSVEPKKASAPWLGQWVIEVPQIVSVG